MDPRECRLKWEQRYLRSGIRFGALPEDFAVLPLPEPRRPRVFRTAVLPAKHPEVHLIGEGHPNLVLRDGRVVDLKTATVLAKSLFVGATRLFEQERPDVAVDFSR